MHTHTKPRTERETGWKSETKRETTGRETKRKGEKREYACV